MIRFVSTLATFRSKLNTFVQLEPGVRSQLLQALALLPLVDQALKVLGFQRTYSILLRLSERVASPPLAEPIPSGDLENAQMISATQAVHLASRYHPTLTCLRRALVLWYLLRRQRLAAELHIGTRFHEGEFQAHAWVDCDGQIVGDRPDIAQQFQPFDTLKPTLNRLTRSL